MNRKTVLHISLLVLIITMLDGCAFIPKTIPTTTHNKITCSTVTTEWGVTVIPFDGPGFYCHDEACAMVIVAIPLVTAAVTLPIVLIGNSIHFLEKQLRCG